MAASQRFLQAAEAAGLEINIFEFPDGTKTSQEAADAAGCELSAIAKSLVFMVDDQAIVAILSGDTRLDTTKLAAVAGGSKARRAKLEEAREATGYAAGGTPAFGYVSPVRVFIDHALKRHTDVWSAAGTPTTIYPVTVDRLVEVSGATWADVSEDR